MVHSFFQSYLSEGILGKLQPLFFADSPVNQRKFYIFQGRQIRYQVKTLKNKTDFPVSDIGQIIVTHPGNVLVMQKVGSARRDIQASQHIHKRGFS